MRFCIVIESVLNMSIVSSGVNRRVKVGREFIPENLEIIQNLR